MRRRARAHILEQHDSSNTKGAKISKSNETLGDRLRLLRKAQALSQRRLAALSDVSPGYVARLELGERTGHTATLGRIARALGVTEHFLRTGESDVGLVYVTKTDLTRGAVAFGCPTCSRLLAENWKGHDNPK